MSDAYDRGLRALARQTAVEQSCDSFLQEGVYCMLPGPTFETIAECKFLQTLGADAVGKYTSLRDTNVVNPDTRKHLNFDILSK